MAMYHYQHYLAVAGAYDAEYTVRGPVDDGQVATEVRKLCQEVDYRAGEDKFLHVRVLNGGKMEIENIDPYAW